MTPSGRKILIVAIFVSLAAGFGGGIWFSNLQAVGSIPIIRTLINQDKGKPKDVDFSLFWQVWNSLHEKYVDPNKLDMQELLYGAIDGMVKSVGDPYTVFFKPVVSQKFQEQINGAFGGVGMELGERNGYVTVIAPIKDTPAYKAGIKAGDKILKVDSKETSNYSIDEVVGMIRGQIGTKVLLNVISEGDKKSRDVTLVREKIRVPALKWQMMNNNIAYIQIYEFSQNVDTDFENAAQEILKSPAKGIVIDLRNNPGGLLESAIDLAGWMLDKGQVVTMEEFKDGSRQEFKSDGNSALRGYPTIILINGGSASASEILSGALHDNRPVQLVGEKSFGKGSVQELENYDNGSSLKVTVAKWLTPKGRSITQLGIDPDVVVPISTYPTASLEFGTPGKDPQLDKALQLLK